MLEKGPKGGDPFPKCRKERASVSISKRAAGSQEGGGGGSRVRGQVGGSTLVGETDDAEEKVRVPGRRELLKKKMIGGG